LNVEKITKTTVETSKKIKKKKRVFFSTSFRTKQHAICDNKGIEIERNEEEKRRKERERSK
jgi:hypothetical protein